MSQSKNESKKNGFKRDGMPIYGENIINFLLKVLIGAFMFWLLYYPIYMMKPDMDFLTQLSYIVLFSVIASFTAMLFSYFIVLLLTKWLKLPKKGLFDLNHFPDINSILYELLAVFLNAVFVASGLLVFLNQQSQSWEQFFLLYLAMKIVTRILAFAFANIITKNIILTIGFSFLFFTVIMLAISEIAQVKLW